MGNFRVAFQNNKQDGNIIEIGKNDKTKNKRNNQINT